MAYLFILYKSKIKHKQNGYVHCTRTPVILIYFNKTIEVETRKL